MVDYTACPMFGGAYGGSFGFIFSWAFMILGSVALVLLIIWLAKQITRKK